MKRFLALALSAVLALSMTACSSDEPSSAAEEPSSSQSEQLTIRVGGLKGPTAMGMVKLMADDAAGRRRRLFRDAQPLQRRRIEHPHVARLVADYHRVFRRRRVQAGPVRVAPLRQLVVVVSLGRHPLSGREFRSSDVVLNSVLDIRPGSAALQRHL